MNKVYLAGQPPKYDDWKTNFENVDGFDFYDPDIDSDQSSSDTYFPQDLEAISKSDFLVANPGLAPSEGTWIEVGYFLALNTNNPGDKCENLIIIWKEERIDWSIEFVKKAGHIVNNVGDAIKKLEQLKRKNNFSTSPNK